MEEREAKAFAEKQFRKLSELDCQWNLLHARYVGMAVEEISKGKPESVDIKRLKALSWVHDLGKVKQEEGHPEWGVKLLEKSFELNETDKDCILNHSSLKKPVSKEAKVFQKADGISLFYPEVLSFRFWAEAKEGKSFDEILIGIKEMYEKYLKAYAADVEAVNLLKRKYTAFFEYPSW
ncbi:MAG TPA: HD domain-containing protein [Candidatus Nanoarchaeia archaeon]|nr:HD domain-containing protein [Candidatus Nanoarchaeia archaeon]